jgi:hypothetical protein
VKKGKSDPMILDEEEIPIAASAVVVQPLAYEDIDLNDYDDPQAVVDYVNEIYHYLMIKERERFDPRYISKKVDVN